ncbi:hypothetical protein [Ulvibacter litoralis]|uniref:Uncharacterized protein n=1 Tax=Ulvibacter litoralis TaxID=227084 RepID=A0A1G7JRN2_9FLAO|nr:hypothetical protein [Ulvibacter litoralis]GHC65875.1 hypothetical protein GCM10008083_33770 [Ulvibacter litoralis]SDF27573.1 hypothetical protein SAMN05421855_1261 [Ulvibacter litoralis]
MNIKFKKWRIAILTLLVLIFSFWFYIHHYDILFDSKSTVTFKAINKETNEAIQNAEIEISRIEKPWYFMWQMHKILNGNTNELGEFSLEISESKRYSVEMSKEYKKRFITDDQTYIGGIEFEGRDVTDEEIIIIQCSKRIKMH